MFSSLRARLWLSYAFLIVTALAVVAFVLILFLLGNPLLYRQTMVGLKAAGQALAAEPNPANGIDTVAAAFNVRVLLYSANGTLIRDTGTGLPVLELPARLLIPRAVPYSA